MKILKPFADYKFLLTLVLCTIFAIGDMLGQELPATEDSVATKSSQIAISDIPSEFNAIANHIVEISGIIQADKKIAVNEVIVDEYTLKLEGDKQEIIESLPSMTYQRLENLIRAWHNYKDKFEIAQGTLKKRIDEIESIKNELKEDLRKWEDISEELKQGEFPEELTQSTDTAIVSLNAVLEITIQRSDTLLLIRSKQAQLILSIDEMIRIMEEEMKFFQSNYFIIDSNPIWSASDSTSQVTNVTAHLKAEAAESFQILKTYLKSNKGIVFFQLIFILVLIIGFIALSRLWPTHELNADSKRETQADYIIHHPIISSLLISMVISIFFYNNSPLVLGDFFVTIMMVSSLVLLPGLLTPKIKLPLIILLSLFLLNVLQDYLPYQSFENRLIIFIQSIAAIGLLIIANKIKREFEFKPLADRIFTGFIGVFGWLMIIALFSNIIGSVKLADFLISSTIGTLTFSVIVVTNVIILNSMMILLIKGKMAQSMPLHQHLKQLIDKRLRPMINWVGLILWFYVALIYFRVLKPVKDAIGSVMDTEFSIASVVISIGAVISFFLIVFFTYIIVRFVKNVFKDEWILKSNLPRGGADALSMLIRYSIVAFGIYLALNSIGLDMNKFGFMAGALGVGIGFGLQSVVLNFIAGLIITFENPIYVGDVIEVDEYMGRVTEIGVRASKVLTWDGSEVIVPNGTIISSKVVNWTLTNQKRRLAISIKTPFDADPQKVIKILSEVACKHTNTLELPTPMVIFNGYEGSVFDFTIYCWVEFSVSLSTKSDIAINAIKALAKAGIANPVPVQKIEIDKGGRKNPVI